MKTNMKCFILQSIFSLALWRLLMTGLAWIDINFEVLQYILLALCFGITHYFFHCIKNNKKIGDIYWWILLAIVHRTIIIPLGYLLIASAAQGVILLWMIFIVGIPFAVFITNKLFKIIKMTVS